MGRAEQITRHLKLHDAKLYCDKNREGTLCVYRQSKRYDAFDFEGNVVLFSRPTPHFIFALTHNWTTYGKPVDWGIEPIMHKLKSGDLHQRDKLAEEMIQEYERENMREERDRSNKNEAFLKDFRKQFAKTFNDVNTSTLEKKDLRRSLDHGNRK